MARPGDTVECTCGQRVEVPKNARLPWHRRPGVMRDCQYSGVSAESHTPLVVFEGYVLACPKCGDKSSAVATDASAKFPLQCSKCRTMGTLKVFVLSGLPKTPPAPQTAAAGDNKRGRFS